MSHFCNIKSLPCAIGDGNGGAGDTGAFNYCMTRSNMFLRKHLTYSLFHVLSRYLFNKPGRYFFYNCFYDFSSNVLYVCIIYLWWPVVNYQDKRGAHIILVGVGFSLNTDNVTWTPPGQRLLSSDFSVQNAVQCHWVDSKAAWPSLEGRAQRVKRDPSEIQWYFSNDLSWDVWGC